MLRVEVVVEGWPETTKILIPSPISHAGQSMYRLTPRRLTDVESRKILYRMPISYKEHTLQVSSLCGQRFRLGVDPPVIHDKACIIITPLEVKFRKIFSYRMSMSYNDERAHQVSGLNDQRLMLCVDSSVIPLPSMTHRSWYPHLCHFFGSCKVFLRFRGFPMQR